MKKFRNYIIIGFAAIVGATLVYAFGVDTIDEANTNEANISKEDQYLAVADSLEMIAEKKAEVELSSKIEDINQSLLALDDEVEVLYTSTRASYYHDKFNGRKTANGEIFSNDLLTAAHKTLAFGTRLKVTNLASGKSVIVTINDRGPYIKGRHIDLSKAAFKEITANNTTRKGVLKVKIEKLPEGYEETREELMADLEELEAIQQLKEVEKKDLKEFSL